MAAHARGAAWGERGISGCRAPVFHAGYSRGLLGKCQGEIWKVLEGVEVSRARYMHLLESPHRNCSTRGVSFERSRV
jgi:hypothetical protein